MLVHVFVCSIETKALALPAHALLWDVARRSEAPMREESSSERGKTRAARLLDAALAEEVLATHFPALQCAVPIDKQGVRRLLQALDKAPVWQFKVLAFGRASDPIAGSDLRTLLQAIAAKPQGFPVAAEILDMRLFSDGDKKIAVDSELLAAGRDLLEMLE